MSHATRRRGWTFALRQLSGLAALLALVALARAEDDAAAIEERLSHDLKYLSSDELEGRGIGTKGIDKAADYIAEEFKKLGLKTEVFEGGPFQKFKLTTDAALGDKNELTLIGPAGADGAAPPAFALKVGADYTPLGLGGGGTVYLPIAFAGYGITGKDENYDDFAGLDVNGKAVIILRHEPQQEDEKSVFNGKRTSPHAPLMRKLSNAYEHGAAAVIFVTDEHELAGKVVRAEKRWLSAVDKLAEAHAEFKKIAEPTPEQITEHRKKLDSLLKDVAEREAKITEEADPVFRFEQGGTEGGRTMPVLHMRREVVDQALKAALGKDLATLEKEIDAGPAPRSADLPGWRIAGTLDVRKQEVEVKNVAAILEGSGPHAEETIVIGAHYDHLGYGGSGSLAPGDKSIHNGADDNGSGATALLEVAREIVARGEPLPRRIVFLAFTAEERGLIGSAHYVKSPVIPMDKTVAMLNMDMVGRLKDDKLIIQGVDTATEFGPLIDGLNEKYQFKLTKQPGGFGPSDHSSFYGEKVPVMHFFTDLHSDYHRPSDDFDKINVPGMRRIAEMVVESAVNLAKAEGRPQYISVARSRDRDAAPKDGDRPYFGSVPDFSQTAEGYAISAVTEDGPAAKGGLKGGDAIIQLGDSKVGNLEDFDNALRKHKAGEKVKVVVRRSGQDVTLEVELGEPR